MFKVDVPPEQIIDGFADDEPGLPDVVCTVIVELKQAVVLHDPTALSQYVVVLVGLNDGDDPDFTRVPPHEPVYQYHEAFVPSDPPVIENVEVPPIQIIEEDGVMLPGEVERVLTVIRTERHPVVLQVLSALHQ